MTVPLARLSGVQLDRGSRQFLLSFDIGMDAEGKPLPAQHVRVDEAGAHDVLMVLGNWCDIINSEPFAADAPEREGGG
jgi:hypothetical protein